MEALPVQHPHAAGIDIGSRSHWVCVGFTSEAASCLIQADLSQMDAFWDHGFDS